MSPAICRSERVSLRTTRSNLVVVEDGWVCTCHILATNAATAKHERCDLRWGRELACGRKELPDRAIGPVSSRLTRQCRLLHAMKQLIVGGADLQMSSGGASHLISNNTSNLSDASYTATSASPISAPDALYILRIELTIRPRSSKCFGKLLRQARLVARDVRSVRAAVFSRPEQLCSPPTGA